MLAAITAANAQDDDNAYTHSQRSAISPTKVTYAFSPLHVTDENIGLGLSAEIFPGNNGIVGIYLPFSLALPRNNNGFYTDYNGTIERQDKPQETYYFYPGVKIYPTGAFKKVAYAIGISLAAGVGRTEQITRTYDLKYTSPYGYTDRVLVSENTANISTFKMGALVTNSINIRPTNHFYMGLELGLGYTYVNKFASIKQPREALLQLGLKFGYAN